MRLVAAFFRLVRWPNLIFIVITQILFHYCIYQPLYDSSKAYQLAWLMLASVCIAGGGYIINDYFDLNIDRINKPGKNVIGKLISRRWAIFWHLSLSITGVLATILAVGLHKWYLVFSNIICVILLWLYSTSFKRQLLIGNIVISLLTSWTILILFFAVVPFSAAFDNEDLITVKFFRISFLYAGFAFIISVIREAIKDVQDMIGDERYGCVTLPIYVGIRGSKIYIAVWLVVLIAAVILLQLYILQFGWIAAITYCVVFIISPMIYLFLQLFKVKGINSFGRLSAITKWIMFSGILSMIFYRLYF